MVSPEDFVLKAVIGFDRQAFKIPVGKNVTQYAVLFHCSDRKGTEIHPDV